jgi:holo-[acyl-carrier protein] synthase
MDLVAVSDVEESLARHGPRYVERVYTQAERAAAAGRTRATRLAALFAAKEATFKVLEAHGDAIGWTNIEIDICARNGISVKLHGAAAAAAQRGGIDTVDVSIAQCERYAAAIALASGGTARLSKTGGFVAERPNT